VSAAAAGPQSKSDEEKPLPPQPIPFSHRVHASAAALKCADCHAIRKPGYAAGLPREETCMACHVSIKAESPAVQRLAGFAKARRAVPWVQVYRLPDYVWFSHESHHKEAGIGCETCHGPVAERDVVTKEKPISMASCMECHAARGASNACNFCHETR
jgi:hypothetical protein